MEALRRGVERGGERVELGDGRAMRSGVQVPVAQAAGVDGEPFERRREPA